MTVPDPPLGLRRADVWILVLATVVGVLLSVGLSLMRGPSYESQALLNGGPDGTPAGPLDMSSDITDRYVATELIYFENLSGAMGDAITEATGISPAPEVTGTQDGQTSVINVSVVGASPEQAAHMARVASDVYIADWQERQFLVVREERKGATDRLGVLRARMETNNCDARPNTSDCQALRAVARGVRADLLRLAKHDETAITNRYVVEPTPEAATQTTSTGTMALVGAIVGFGVGALVVTWRVRRRWPAPEESG